MKVVGIIAEYNPFHTGHEYQLGYAREVLGADYIIVVMSGDFTQRGLPAIFDKHTRAEHAIMCGADLVLELPVISATASAEGFAHGAVRLLESCGVVDELLFGCENPDLDLLKKQAKILLEEPKEYSEALQAATMSGDSFATARAKALTACGVASPASNSNDILGVEYVKAIMALSSSIAPVPMQRQGASYNSTALSRGEAFTSATSIRSSILNQSFDSILDFVPDSLHSSYQSLLEANLCVLPSDFDAQLYYALRSGVDIGSTPDCDKALAARINNLLPEYKGFLPFCDLIKVKNYTHSRISRVLCHALLGIKADDYAADSALPVTPYIRILAMKEESTKLLSNIKARSNSPIIVSPKDTSDCRSISLDVLAADLYRDVLARNSGKDIPTEFTRKFTPI